MWLVAVTPRLEFSGHNTTKTYKNIKVVLTSSTTSILIIFYGRTLSHTVKHASYFHSMNDSELSNRSS